MAVRLKLMLWPLALLLLFYRRGPAPLILVIVSVMLNAIANLMVGLDVIVYPCTVVSGEAKPIYWAHEGNFALWGLAWRLSAGTGFGGLGGT
jgi:hypothetical protein